MQYIQAQAQTYKAMLFLETLAFNYKHTHTLNNESEGIVVLCVCAVDKGETHLREV